MHTIFQNSTPLQCNTTQFKFNSNAIRHIQSNAISFAAIQFNSIQSNPTQRNPIQVNSMRLNAILCSVWIKIQMKMKSNPNPNSYYLQLPTFHFQISLKEFSVNGLLQSSHIVPLRVSNSNYFNPLPN